MLRLFVLVVVLLIIVPSIVDAKGKLKLYCQGTSCITGVKALAGGWEGMSDWHICRSGEQNACRKWSKEKPK